MLVTADFETFYSKDYSLKKMPTVLYVRHPEFKVHCLGIKINDGPTEILTGAQITARLHELPWDEIDLIGHNLYFDAMILVEHYGLKPRRYIDTLAACRALLPVGLKRGLADVAPLFGLSPKVDDYLGEGVKGVRDLSPEALAKLSAGCVVDCDNTWGIYQKLWHLLPAQEHEVIHMTTRMGVESVIQLDQAVLVEEARVVEERRKAKLDEAGRSVEVLSSNDQFLALLRTFLPDDQLPWKKNDKGKVIPAFAKNDAAWVKFKLDNPDLIPLCEAREAAKSTIAATRTKRFLQIARTTRGTLPMAYKYAGAHTFRFSGADGLNVQNLPNLHRSNLRLALMAPKGHVINVADSSQIELRQQLLFSGQQDQLAVLARGEDPYRQLAANIFGVALDQVAKRQRGVAKATKLGCQYGMGPPKYRAYMAGGPLGLDPLFFTLDEAQHNVGTFRADHPYTVKMWHTLDDCIPLMQQKDCHYPLGPIIFRFESIELPNGMRLDYSDLRPTEEGGWAYGVGVTKFLWGGTLLENIIQALARIVVIDQAVTIDREVAPVIGWTHDEVLALSPEHRAEEDQAAMIEIMSTPPAWAPDLPLAAEGGFDVRYSK